MKIKDRFISYILPTILLAVIAYSAVRLLTEGHLGWHIRQPQYQLMMAELLLLTVIVIALLFSAGKLRVRFLLLLLLTAVFLWIHQVFVPFLMVFCYCIYLTAIGSMFRKKSTQTLASVWLTDFMIGMMAVIVCFSLMSALGFGSIKNTQYLVAASFFPVVICAFLRNKQLLKERLCSSKNFDQLSLFSKLLIAGMLVSVFLQLGRMNLTIDFDSAWYGLRTPYILNNGNGIYKNLGTIGIVYTYSKGFEVLAMPLSTLPSFGFTLALNVWITIFTLAAAFLVGRQYLNQKYALLFAFLIAATPGIMNMSTTSKADSLTLFIQILMFYYLIRYEAEHQMQWLLLGTGAYLFSWVLKPTALVFSTAIYGMAVLYFIFRKYKPVNLSIKKFIFLLLPVMTVIVMWARTFLLTGVPVTSVYSSVFTRLGFQMKYPFRINHIPDTGAELSIGQQLAHMIRRTVRFFISPVGRDMGHVILAWGSLTVAFLLLIWLCCCTFKQTQIRNMMKESRIAFLYIIALPFILINLVSLYRLDQVDGNYFMMFYFMVILLGMICIYRYHCEKVERILVKSVLVSAVFSFLVMTLTNWAWVISFTPIKLQHKGYYNHVTEIHQKLSAQGNEQIWNRLAADSANRVIIVGEHPEMLLFPCSTQSYDDITGAWGNVALVKTMDRFIEFMDYAKTDYVYIQAGYLEPGTRAYELMRYLIENETLTDLIYEHGNVLARVDISGRPGAKGTENLVEFDQIYRVREERNSPPRDHRGKGTGELR